MPPTALNGLRVLDLSTIPAGAWCSRLLADFGADVVFVEPPGGHPLRPGPETSATYAALGTYVLANKRAIALDPAAADDRPRLLELIRAADVVVSSYSPARLAELGLKYGELGAPALIMAHVTPYGMSGDLANVPGNDLAVSARSGWASINGEAAREPLKPSGWQPSFCTGVLGYAAVLAALHQRDQAGTGQEIDIAEFDVMVSAFAPALLRGQYTGEAGGRKKDADLTAGPVPVKDGHFALTISRAHFWRDAMTVLELPDLAEDRRYDASWYRQQHKEEYVNRVQEKMAQWTKKDLFEELAARRVVAGPVMDMGELVENEHLVKRGYWVTPEEGGGTFPGAPFKLSATPWRMTRGLPSSADDSNAIESWLAAPGGGRPAATGTTWSGGPLNGLRAIVLTQAWAGTFCTALLGLLGAEVIQIEVRKRPDSWRGAYDGPIPAALKDVPTAQHPWNTNFLYNSVNLNKRCITLDLQTKEGVAVFRRLLPFADIVAENFSPRVLGNLGIDYQAMKAIKPDVILCSLSAYGHDGPWANIPGIGGTIEPTSGMSALLGYEGGPPLNSGQMYPDAVAGMNGVAGILTALRHRDATGEGQYVDLSMQESNLSFVADAAVEFLATGKQRPRMGNSHPEFAPHGIYPCAGTEQWVALACETEEQWAALCRVSGHPGWASDPRFATRAARKANEAELNAAIDAWTRELQRDALVERLSGAGVVAAPVLDAHEIARDHGLRARGTVEEVTHPETGRWPQAGCPVHFSAATVGIRRPAPRLGEHSAEVLRELLNMPGAEIEALVASGVSGTGPPDGEVAT